LNDKDSGVMKGIVRCRSMQDARMPLVLKFDKKQANYSE